MTGPSYDLLVAVQMLLYATIDRPADRYVHKTRRGRFLTRARLELIEGYLIRRVCR